MLLLASGWPSDNNEQASAARKISDVASVVHVQYWSVLVSCVRRLLLGPLVASFCVCLHPVFSLHPVFVPPTPVFRGERVFDTVCYNAPTTRFFPQCSMKVEPNSQLAQPKVRARARGGVLHGDCERGVRGER